MREDSGQRGWTGELFAVGEVREQNLEEQVEGAWGCVRYGLQPPQGLGRAAGLLQGGRGLAPSVASTAALGPGTYAPSGGDETTTNGNLSLDEIETK